MHEEPQFFKYFERPPKVKTIYKILSAILIIFVAVVGGVILYLGIQKIERMRNPKQNVKMIPVVTDTPKPTSTPIPTAEPTPKLITDPSQVTGELSEGAIELLNKDIRTPVRVKGIYVTGPKAGSEGMNQLIKLVEETELNAMVIDIKNDSGEITYKMDHALVKELGASKAYIKDIDELVQTLKEKKIYLIARIVAFKDPILAEKKPEYSIKNKDGSIFRDKDGLAWVNPYEPYVWEYLVEVAKEAVKLGFDEIQFDYIRFSTDKAMKQADFGLEQEGKTKQEAINKFTAYAMEQLMPLGVFVSADVYGAIINSEADASIVGQDYANMARNLDYICPMIYPSHYADGAYGIDYPDTKPYDLIYKVLVDSKKTLKTDHTTKHQAIVRPWLQDFTASWLKNYIPYGKEEIQAQIQALYDAGYEEWILWNGSNQYTKDALSNKY